jgi:predicted transcriptional regulator of viral defense system
MPGSKDDELRELAATRGNRIVRPRDAAHIYRTPSAEFARLAEQGVLARVATGYWALVPDLERGRWRPDTAAIALGIARADYGRDAVALIGASAARHHGAWPRALALAFVATPKQRPELRTPYGEIRFAKRDVAQLDTEAIHTEVTDGWTTTREQTIVDIAKRPELAVDIATARLMLTELVGQADIAHLFEVARRAPGWRALLGPAALVDEREQLAGDQLRNDVLSGLLAAQARRSTDTSPQ